MLPLPPTPRPIHTISPLRNTPIQLPLPPLSDPPVLQSPEHDLRSAKSANPFPGWVRARVWTGSDGVDVEEEVEVDEGLEFIRLGLNMFDDLPADERKPPASIKKKKR